MGAAVFASYGEVMTRSPSGYRAGRELIRRLRGVDSEGLLAFLTERQYVRPQASISEVLSDAEIRIGVCPVAARRAIAWLELAPEGAVGRLRRTELTQLARCLHRFMRHAVPRTGSAKSCRV